jgi:hypothetical protein
LYNNNNINIIKNNKISIAFNNIETLNNILDNDEFINIIDNFKENIISEIIKDFEIILKKYNETIDNMDQYLDNIYLHIEYDKDTKLFSKNCSIVFVLNNDISCNIFFKYIEEHEKEIESLTTCIENYFSIVLIQKYINFNRILSNYNIIEKGN